MLILFILKETFLLQWFMHYQYGLQHFQVVTQLNASYDYVKPTQSIETLDTHTDHSFPFEPFFNASHAYTYYKSTNNVFCLTCKVSLGASKLFSFLTKGRDLPNKKT